MTEAALRNRIATERRIMRRIVTDALKAGYALNVDFGDGDALPKPTTNRKEILKAMMQGDDDRLYFYNKETATDPIGWVWLVYGNDGWDVLSDYTTNLEEVLQGANQLAESLEN